MYKKLQQDIVFAMKNKDKELLSSLRLIKDEIQKKYLHEDITDEKFQSTIKSLIKQMEKSLAIKEDVHNRHLLNTCLKYKATITIDKEPIISFINENNFKNLGEFMKIAKNKFSVDKKVLVDIFNETKK